MPPKRALGHNARNAYIEDQFPHEARRRNLDGQALWPKRKKDTRRERVVKACSTKFPTLSEREKRWYQYEVEKKWPLWFERANATVNLDHIYPGPEWVVRQELKHLSKGLKGDPKRNQWLKKQREDTADMPDDYRDHYERTRDRILCARAKQRPFTPNAPPVPGNNTRGLALPSEELQDVDKSILPHGEWICHNVLYEGHTSHVMVYLQRDEENKTTARMVLKRVIVPGTYPASPGHKPLSGEEGDVHFSVSRACPGHTVKFLNDHLSFDESTREITKAIMTEWVPHGTLASMIENYDKKGHLIPEPFVWYCFKAVTENALALWNGHVQKGAQAGWERTINCDIKPDNILLDEPNPAEPMEWARRYPVPRVGDYGASFRTYRGLDNTGHPMAHLQRRNPPDFRGFGTPGYLAPEVLPHSSRLLERNLSFTPERTDDMATRLANDIQGDDMSIHSWTMVWQIGMLMWAMMANNSYGGTDRDQVEVVVDYSDPAGSRDQPKRETRRGASLRPAYSGRLIELVYQCLIFLPRNRINLEDLWDQVLEGCNDMANVFGANQTAAPPNGPNNVSFVADKYPLGENVLNDEG